MAEEKIEVVVVADDSELNESLERQADNFKRLSEEAKATGKAIDESMKPKAGQDVGAAAKKAAKEVNNQSKAVAKGSKNLRLFNKIGGRSVSMLSRFTGLGGRAARSLAGLSTALGATPFGTFAALAGAASIAYSFFSDKLNSNNDEIIKKNKELEASVNSLSRSLTEGFQEGKIIAIDLEVLKGLDEATARLRKIEVFEENISRLRVQQNKDLNELSALETKLANFAIKDTAKRLEAEKRVIEIRKERLSIANQISSNEANILRLELEGEQERQRAAEERKKRAIEANKLFDSLIRDELEKRLKALDDEAARREQSGRQNITDTKQLNKFLLLSQSVLEQDKEKVREQFRQAELKARRALNSQLVIDEEKAAIQAAKNAAADRVQQIKSIAKDDQEKANLLKLNESKLQSDLAAITKKFADQRKQENLKEQQEVFALRSASFEAQVRQEQALFENELLLEKQAFEATKRTEEELTAFNKKQADEKLRQDLNFQVARLQLAREFNKELTKEETAALDAQIQLLKTRLKGIGAEVKGELKSDSFSGGLLDLLGLTPEQIQNTEAIQGALEQATQAISNAIGERIALSEQEIAKRDENLSNLQETLNSEIRLAELGKAANIKQVQDQIAKEKAARDKAQKEKEEAAKAQFILDTALQTSNLITAVSNLYSTLSGLPFGIGVALATALSGVMIGTFVASKAQAAQAAGFADGGQYGYTGSGSKYTESKALGERPYDYHKGEYIFPQELVNEFGLNGVPVTNVREVLGNHFSDNTPPMGVLKKKNKSINKTLSKQTKAAQLSIQNGIKKAIEQQLPILKEIADKPVAYSMPDGSTHIRLKGKTHIFKSDN